MTDLRNHTLAAPTDLLARALMAFIFIMAGYNKIGGFAGTQGWMESMGVPGILLYPVVALELFGGIALLIGLKTRLVAFLLAGFCVLSALIFHNDLANDFNAFAKNLAMAGGFLLLTLHGPGKLSLDAKLAK
ncbi:DoxX family protein [Ferrimonas balearica]|uniref:DoxX family protein n=1 Tax=Ferrimonas balearica TaxID=44012 RepID=UPI001C580C1D|nr:DoxX family protein [Ferrimonas balearica]MBW3140859.1 DoxX family protein [Ferrimonas balearica]MBW3165938.1 DoxX family protein [Ferrimonas balearica]MBY5981848.1 DoxX family protein [Ferrimonas balearica]MBY6108116.1 DoxX family protein [Ferrimonas balearica]MBY6225459.1 DoxX family protein [Ferrimonas balearica]